MYCYVIESPSTSKIRRLDEQVISLLRSYGISGEIAFANPARPAREITQVALSKGYSTIIAVGGDRVINGVAQSIQSTRAAMGIIPIDANPRIKELIGTSDPSIACEILRRRNITLVDVTLIDPGQYFLTEAKIEVTNRHPVRVHVDDMVIETKVTNISLFNDGTIELIDTRSGTLNLKRALDWITRKPKIPANITRLHGNYLKVETIRPLPVRVGPDIIGQTPFVAAVKPNALKLITKNDIVRTKFGEKL